MGEYVVFAIDNDDDLHTNAKFLRYVDQRRAMQEMDGTMKLCIGSYLGKVERSYIVSFSDFVHHIMDSGYVDNQESIMVLRDGYYGKVYATLKYNNYGYAMEDGSGDMFLGILKPVDKDEAMANYGWTYRPDMDQYFIVEEINEAVA